MLYETFVASLAKQVMPEVGSDVVALMPEVRRTAPYISELVARAAWEETAQEEFTWYARDLKARQTQINNGGAAYTNATTALVVDDSTVFGVGTAVKCLATDEVLYVISKDDATNTITVRRGVGAGGGGGAAAHANSVADNAFLENMGVAAPPGGDKLPERWFPDSERSNICQFFRETVNEDGRKRATKLLVGSSNFAGTLATKTIEFYNAAELAAFFGVFSKTVTDAAGKRVTMMRGIATDANQVAVNANITKAAWDAYMRTVFSTGSDVRNAYFGLDAMDYVLSLFQTNIARNAADIEVGQVVKTVICQGGMVRLIPHLGFRGSRAKDILLVDAVAAPHRLRNMGAARFTDITGAEFDGKVQVVRNRQGTSEDLVAAEIMADFGVQGGEKTFNWYFKNITGAA